MMEEEIELDSIYNEDGLIGMNRIAARSVDLILCDLPYGTTACKWDKPLPFIPLWSHYNRIIKDNGAIVLFGSQPFTTRLINSNLSMFRYEWIWEKQIASGFMNARKMPNKTHENICVFYKRLPTYNPQKYRVADIYIEKRKAKQGSYNARTTRFIDIKGPASQRYVKPPDDGMRFPDSILCIPREVYTNGLGHPTQKPVALFEYLIKTYTNEGETVLDNCIGSGTTAVACINTNRRYIGFEKDSVEFERARNRVARAKMYRDFRAN